MQIRFSLNHTIKCICLHNMQSLMQGVWKFTTAGGLIKSTMQTMETEIPFQKETLFLEMFEDVILFCYDFSFSEPVLLGKDRWI